MDAINTLQLSFLIRTLFVLAMLAHGWEEYVELSRDTRRRIEWISSLSA